MNRNARGARRQLVASEDIYDHYMIICVEQANPDRQTHTRSQKPITGLAELPKKP